MCQRWYGHPAPLRDQLGMVEVFRSSVKFHKVQFWVQFSLVRISGCDRSPPILMGRARDSPLTPKAASPPG